MQDARGGSAGHHQLRINVIGVPHIVFFVVAAAAPLTAVVGVTPAAFAFGNGVGVPGTFLLVGMLYLLFSVGYTAMSRHVQSAGGFYSYIITGLGRPTGVASAFVALLTYNAIDIAVYGLFGFFVREMVISAGGPAIPWLVYAAVLSIVTFLCGMRNIEFSGHVLGTCMIAEIGVLLVLGAAILLTGGPEPFTLRGFTPAAVMAPGLGVALVFTVTAFIGFEATAIFGVEARDPHVTIPRATYAAVLIIALLYAFATWTISLHYGPSIISAEARAHTGTLYLDAARKLLGPQAVLVMNALLTTSILACALSFHNTINRYLFAVAREGLVWEGFARTHPRFQSPHVAGAVQTVLALGVTALFACYGQDPYTVLFAWMGALSSLGILVLQVLVCLSVIAFFQKAPRGIGLFGRLLAPALTAIGLGITLVLMIDNLSLISGSESLIVDLFPVMVAAVGAGGLLFAARLKRAKPDVYAALGRHNVREEPGEDVIPAQAALATP